MPYMKDQLERLIRAKVEDEVIHRDYPALPFSFIIYNWLQSYDISLQIYPGEQLVYHVKAGVANNKINLPPTEYAYDVIVL